MNILVLAAGDTGADPSGYPIWLSELDGEILLERQVKALTLTDEDRLVFAFRSEDIATRHVDSIARQISRDPVIVSIKKDTAGAACTALLTIGALDLDDELIVASATDHIDVDFQAIVAMFRDRNADAGLLTFESLHPRYSFVRADEDQWLVESAEKRPISRHANAGFYWYAKARDFIDSICRMVLKDAHVNGVFYLSPALNEMILQGKRICVQPIPSEAYHPLKDQRQFELLEHQNDGRKRSAP